MVDREISSGVNLFSDDQFQELFKISRNGISQIIKAPDNFNKKTINSFVFGALGYKDQIIEGDQSIHLINFDKDFSKIVLSDVIPVGERIRDMILINETNTVLTVLESIPAIGFVTLVN